MKSRIALAAAAALLFGSNAWAESSQMFGTRFVGESQFLYQVAPTTGSATLVGKIGIGKRGLLSVPANAVDFDSRGTLYGGWRSTISRIDTGTGRALPITSTFIDEIRGLAFSPDDRLFVAGQSFSGKPALYQVDTHEGTISHAGFLEMTAVFGIDFDPHSGELYVLGLSLGFEVALFRITDINPEDGEIIGEMVVLVNVPGSLSGLDIDSEGTFRTNVQVQFPVTTGSDLATINPRTGAIIDVVGPTGTTPPAVFLSGLASKP